MASQDLPITGVCVVSDPARCPPNYTVIDRTQDRPEDADLWRDGYFSRRVMRYLCIERQTPTQSQDVLVDVTLVMERDPVPPGFTILEFTHDTREKATKKKCLCVRWMVPSMTSDAITDLTLLSKAQRRAPIGYTLVGELNSMSLCYKMGKVPGSASKPLASEVQGYSVTPQAYSMNPSSEGLPYTIAPGIAQGYPGSTSSHPGPPAPTPAHVNPLSGIEWKMNARYSAMLELQHLTIPDIRGKTLMDIEAEFAYDFSVERAVTRQATS